jgi:hypothetical protein
MELCEGGSLTKWVKAEKRSSARQVQEVGVRIADALAATHARGVLHRDVKPANILIDSYGHAGLADFGLAALPDPGMESDSFEAITPAYAPPEVLKRQAPTEAGDVYSLGATLYALLSGHPPRWPGAGMPSVTDMLKRQEQPIEPIPGVHEGLMDVLLSALATDPAERPAAAQFRDKLSEINLEPPPPEARRAVPVAVGAEPEVLETTTDPWPSKAGRRSRRRRSGILLAAVVLLAAAVAASLVALLPMGGRSPEAGLTPGGSPKARPTSAQTVPAGRPSQAVPPTTPPATTQVPDSFVDCSEQLGPDTYCTPEPECWTGVRGYADSPLIGGAVSCYKLHYYQTFAAGQLDFVPLRQSQLEKLPQVKKVCTSKVVNSMLAKEDRRSRWQIEALPQQKPGEMYYRCIFGPWGRTSPITLQKPE